MTHNIDALVLVDAAGIKPRDGRDLRKSLWCPPTLA